MRPLAWIALAIATALLALVTLLAISPPYEGLATGLHPQPLLLLAPLRTYLFRSALTNTALLLLTVAPLSVLLGWGWAKLGIPKATHPLLLLPLLFPGALIGLLWQPIFAPWLALAQAELSLTITGMVMLWRSVPTGAWLFAQEKNPWRKALALPVLFILLDAGLILILTGGEPYNAAHTWSSWSVQQLWVNRAWGYAASSAGALAFLVALVSIFASPHTEAVLAAPPPLVPARAYPSLLIALAWVLGPFLLSLAAFLVAPIQAMHTLLTLGGFSWLLNATLIWIGATALLVLVARSRASVPLSRWLRAFTLALLPISTVALAYLTNQWPILGNRWTLLLLTTLFAAGLLVGNTRMPMPPRQRWLRAAGGTLLVMAHTFPLHLVLQLPPDAWTPMLGIVWTLSGSTEFTATQGAALLLCGTVAWLGGWVIDSSFNASCSKQQIKLANTVGQIAS